MKHVKLKPNDTTVDHRYQRDLDAKRVEAMARAYNQNLIGVPVLSLRADGTYVRIDGQHRLAANIAAGYGDVPVPMEVHEGLSLEEEAALYDDLNTNRRAIGKIDLFKARLARKNPTALEIQAILKSAGCKIVRSQQRGGVMAVAAVERAYRKGNLGPTMIALHAWLDGAPDAFHKMLIGAVSEFLSAHPDADPMHLASRLENYAPQKLLTRLKRESQQAAFSKAESARLVIAEIYNHRTPKAKRVSRLAA